MSTNNADNAPADNEGALKSESSTCCEPSCGCHATGPAPRYRWIIGVIVLVAAGVLVARAVVKNGGAAPVSPAAGFSAGLSPAAPAPPAQGTPPQSKVIQALSDLNTVAVNSDAVFVFIPGKDTSTEKDVMLEIQNAARAIETRAGNNIGLFTLKLDSPDYAQIMSQVTPPGVLALVKGRGMNAVSGDITEAKLVQAFVSAASAGGGCGPAASSGCCPR